MHFESVFSIPPPDPCPSLSDAPPPSMLFDKPHIDSSWYDPLMQPITGDELLAVLSDTALQTSPGEDQVSSGVWKLAIHGSPCVREWVASLFTACLQSSYFPTAWKSSIIHPLIKDALKERSMSNIRPISLQSCLGKLFNKVLAYRLAKILSLHPILHPSQRGFVLGGSITKCIDELLDAWDWSRCSKHKHELYTLFYDIKQAYDSVQAEVLVRALHRIHLPASFVGLIAHSLTGLTSCVRTVYGPSRFFDVQRSVRQGDPLAPLLFVILMDALHEGLDTNPITGRQHGLQLMPTYLPSLGYADDTTVLTSSLPDLRIQNDWVAYFMRFNSLRLNPAKCELVGRNGAGEPVSDLAVAAHGVTVEGQPVKLVPHEQAIRYLGVHVRFDGEWPEQKNKALSSIGKFTRTAAKFDMPIGCAVYMFNLFLLPKLELALHYVHGSSTTLWLKSCDRLLIGCIKHLASSPLRLRHTPLALALRLNLPSWMELSIKVSELFLRMNSSAHDRWGQLGRALMREQCGSVVTSETSLPHLDSGTRLTRAARLAAHGTANGLRGLSWSLHLAEEGRRGARLHSSLLTVPPMVGLPHSFQCSSSERVAMSAESISYIAHDCWTGWDAAFRPMEVHCYTDGSYDRQSSSSSWAAVVHDAWLEDNFELIPSDEHAIGPHHVRGGLLVGASIAVTQGVYPAELQAIARVLAMLPLSSSVHIHTDSQSSIAAIRSFQAEVNERARLRMSARPLLQLISHLTRSRWAAGGDVTFHHVKAHTDGTDIHSVGNRLADYQANRARTNPDAARPITLAQLPLDRCEHFMRMVSSDTEQQVIDDVRRVSQLQLRSAALARWCRSDSELHFYAGQSLLDLGRMVLRHGSPSQQSTFVHVLTNSIHWFWLNPARGEPSLCHLGCRQCGLPASVPHIAACSSSDCARFRHMLHAELIRVLSGYAACSSFIRRHRHLPVAPFLLKLFPYITSPTAPDYRDRHLAMVMIGAVSSAQSKVAIGTLGFDDSRAGMEAELGRKALIRFRLACLDTVGKFYAGCKSKFA